MYEHTRVVDMLNQAQKDFLNSMIGQKGYIIETIKEYDLCPLSIKILYLTRSIQHPPEIFLKQLDKLYLPDMEVNQIEKHIDFLVHLKTINDLCFNSNIQFIDNFEIASLEYYFAHLGLIVDSKEIKIAVKQAIQERIFELSYQHESDILLQM